MYIRNNFKLSYIQTHHLTVQCVFELRHIHLIHHTHTACSDQRVKAFAF